MGGGKGGGGPKTPPYMKLLNRQNEIDKEAALTRNLTDHTQQFGPGGSTTWEYDPVTKRNTQTTKLDEMGQRSWDRSGNAFNGRMSQLASRGSWNPQSKVPTYDPHAGDKMSEAMYQQQMLKMRPEQNRENAQLSNRFASMGLSPGSYAYDSANRALSAGHNTANQNAALSSIIAGGDESRKAYSSALAGEQQGYTQELQNWTQPFDEATQFQNYHSGVAMPQLPGYSTSAGYTPGNLTQAAQAGYGAKMGQQSASNAKTSGLINSGINAFSAMK